MKKKKFLIRFELSLRLVKLLIKKIDIAVLIGFYHILPIDQIKNLRYFISFLFKNYMFIVFR